MKQSVKHLNIFDDELLEEIKKSRVYNRQRPPKFGITQDELQEQTKVSLTTARRILVDMVKKQGWKKERMIYRERLVTVYYK